MENEIYNILNDMSEVLNIQQMRLLQEVLLKRLQNTATMEIENVSNFEYLNMFVAAKNVEGCSERTIAYYKSTIYNMLEKVNIPIRQITTEVLREYLRLRGGYFCVLESCCPCR